jgi:hypothetical protein
VDQQNKDFFRSLINNTWAIRIRAGARTNMARTSVHVRR